LAVGRWQLPCSANKASIADLTPKAVAEAKVEASAKRGAENC